MSLDLAACVTTIHPPGPAMAALAAAVSGAGGLLVVAGDAAGPAACDLPATEFWPIEAQREMAYALAEVLPDGHYARKNLAYLQAMGHGARCIYETDDDNAPLPSWAPRSPEVTARVAGAQPWCNAYRCFCDTPIWPRGYAVGRAATDGAAPPAVGAAETVRASVQQGLFEGDPDVDAVFRLAHPEHAGLRAGPSVRLAAGSWCPFNSQSTWWWPAAYPLMYLPSHCSQRATDIWRSFVAQRCLWAMEDGVAYHGPETRHDRNAHDLLSDFEAEIPCYLHNERITQRLGALELIPGPGAAGANARTCWAELVAMELLPSAELDLFDRWLADVASALH